MNIPEHNTDIRVIADWILRIASEHHFLLALRGRAAAGDARWVLDRRRGVKRR
jgi:hypothetical protein